jgi:hypothetical protein
VKARRRTQVRTLRRNTLVGACCALAFLGGLWLGCSKDQSPVAGIAHPPEWSDTSEVDFHGQKVVAVGNGLCVDCHGPDFGGGPNGISCYTCHSLYPHSPEWNSMTSQSSHGTSLASSAADSADCMGCHGSDLTGGRSGVSCVACHGSTTP